MLVTCISISAALSDAIYLEILGINLLLHCKNVTQFFPSFKHKSLLYYLYYALDASGFLEKSTFLSTWQAYSACIDNIGSRAQGNMLIFSVSCCSFMLVRSTHVRHSLLLWSQIFRLKIV